MSCVDEQPHRPPAAAILRCLDLALAGLGLLAVVVASARSLPDLICAWAAGTVSIMALTCPPSRSDSAGPLPL